MTLDPFLAWLESTSLSEWVVSSPSLLAFPGILTLHAVGMAFAVGISGTFSLRVLGVAPQVPLAEWRRFMPVLWAGFWLNAVSGLLLLVGYPTKALTNPVFYLKLALIAAALVVLLRMARSVFGQSPGGNGNDVHEASLKPLAIVLLACWVGAITAGRLLAYTYTRLTQLH